MLMQFSATGLKVSNNCILFHPSYRELETKEKVALTIIYNKIQELEPRVFAY